MQNQQRHLAAILFTDIVGYTALMQRNEEEAVRIMKRYNSVLQKAVTDHEGRILNDYGDGNLCSFPSATNAVKCAIKIQQELRQEPAIPLRIGLHIGEIFFEDGKVYGDGVNIASRIQSLGKANMILISGEINNKIKNHPDFSSVLIGEFEFKNVEDPINVFALANAGLTVPKKEQLSGKLRHTGKKAPSKKLFVAISITLLLLVAWFIYKKYSNNNNISSREKTIAILPFKNISVNKEENEPFCVGVALELQKKIELLGALIPIAPQSVERYRDTKLSIAEIAKELGGISFILQGSVLRDKNKVKVFVSLSDVLSGKEIWSDDFPGEVEDIFSLQEDIAQQVAFSLQVKMTPDEQNRMARIATRNTTAIDAYNEALTSYTKLVSEVHPLYWDSLISNPRLHAEFLKTLSLCDKAINTDPRMAEAYVLKGQAYKYSIDDWFATHEKKRIINDSVRQLAKIAFDIDRSSADAYLLISKTFPVRDSVIGYLEKAFASNPNSFEVNSSLGEYYTFSDPAKAIRFSKKAIRLNPISVWTPHVYQNLGFIYHNFGDFEKAELYQKKAIELSNNPMDAIKTHRGLTITYLHWGKADSAIKYANLYANQTAHPEINALYEMAEAYCNLKNDCAKAAGLYEQLWHRYPNRNYLHRWAIALLQSGKIKEGKEKLQTAMSVYHNKNDYDYAGMCALIGDKETALRILRQYTWEWGSIYLIQHDKLFDNIRGEADFREIVRKALDEKTKFREKIRRMEERGEL